MIETCNSYKVGDRLFESFEAAQLHALTDLFETIAADSSTKTLAEHLYANRDEVLSILTMSEPKERTRKPRSDRGKKHKPQTVDEVRRIPEVATPGVKVEGSGKYKNT